MSIVFVFSMLLYVRPSCSTCPMLKQYKHLYPPIPHFHCTLRLFYLILQNFTQLQVVYNISLLNRLNIAFVINKFSQHMHKPTTDHQVLVKRLLRYLCGTLNHGLQLYHDSPTSFHAFFDANQAGNINDFSFTDAYIVYLSRTSIS